MLRNRLFETDAFRTLARWATRVTGASRESMLSVADQAVVSGVSFLSTVFLGRWCGAAELGAYSLGLTIVVLLVGAQMALIAIPYTNHFRRVAETERRAFAGCCLIGQLLFSGAVTLLLASIAAALLLTDRGGNIRVVLMMLVPVLPPVLLRDFARRFAFAHLRMGAALALDSFVAVVQVGGLVLLLMTGNLNALTAFAVMGIGAAAGGLGALFLMRAQFAFRLGLLRTSLVRHWTYGRWVLASTSMAIAQGYLMHWLLALTGGTTQTGVFAACMTVVLLVNPLLMAIGNVLEPKAARAIVEKGHRHLRRIIWRISFSLGAAMVVYFVVLFFAGGWLVSTIFAGTEFVGRGHLVAVLALSMLGSAVGIPISHGLRAMDRPDLSFRGAAVSLLVTLLAGLVLVPRYGMLFGAYALLLGVVTGTVVRIVLFVQLSARPRIHLKGLAGAVEAAPPQ